MSDKEIIDEFKLRVKEKSYTPNSARMFLILYRFMEKKSDYDNERGKNFISLSFCKLASELSCSIGYLQSNIKELEKLGIIERKKSEKPFIPYTIYMKL